MRGLNFIEDMLTQWCWYMGPPVRDGYGGYKYSDPIEIRCRIEKSVSIYDRAKLDADSHDSFGFFIDPIVTDGFLFDTNYSKIDIIDNPQVQDRMKIMSVTAIADLINNGIVLYEARMR